ncbi:MAG: DUF86 domain-containing protein [Candidatus Hatepunaea meridiana]|nr:DUF86 domain-containing protein [Candidatus Hatepunaea meridiana]
MFDRELALEILEQIQTASETILTRFKPVKVVSDFTGSPAGMEKLDSICMLLIAIGESLKNLDKITNNTLLSKYPQIDWKRAKGLRDIISHQYFDVNAEAIFGVCETKINPLVQVVTRIIEDIKRQT